MVAAHDKLDTIRERLNDSSAVMVGIGAEPLDEKVCQPLSELLETKDHLILTTRQDGRLAQTFSDDKVCAVQGDQRYLQCIRSCHDELYPADSPLEYCPQCGGPLKPWVRSDYFMEGKKYQECYRKLNDFLHKHLEDPILFLELSVGQKDSMFIREPFHNLTYQIPGGFYISAAPRPVPIPFQIRMKPKI